MKYMTSRKDFGGPKPFPPSWHFFLFWNSAGMWWARSLFLLSILVILGPLLFRSYLVPTPKATTQPTTQPETK